MAGRLCAHVEQHAQHFAGIVAIAAHLHEVGVLTQITRAHFGIGLKAAWFLSHRIREAMRSGDLSPMSGNGGIVVRNPFDLVTVLQFGALLTAIAVASKIAASKAGEVGAYALAAISGLAEVDAITLSRIADARLFRETLSADMDQAEVRVGALLDSALRQTYGTRSFDEVLSSDRSTMMHEIRDKLLREAKPLGIEIVDVRIRRTDLDGPVLQSAYDRMRSERNAIATDTRSRGEANKTRMKAETDRLYVEKTADARRQAETLRGQGEGESNRIFAEAFQKDPDFFAFYRSMQAYEQSFKAGDTRFVSTPNSDFYKYFGNPTGK